MKPNLSLSLILIATILVGMASWNLYFKDHRQEDSVNIHAFPKKIGEWDSEELTITEHEYDILETRNAFTRRYFTPNGKEVYLFIVYSESNRRVAHPPEICYAGSGVTFVSNEKTNIRLKQPPFKLEAIKNLVEMSPYQQVMYYWFKVGDSFTASYWNQQLLIATKTLLGKPASSALVRLSATVKDHNVQLANQTVEEFANLIYPLLMQYLP